MKWLRSKLHSFSEALGLLLFIAAHQCSLGLAVSVETAYHGVHQTGADRFRRCVQWVQVASLGAHKAHFTMGAPLNLLALAVLFSAAITDASQMDTAFRDEAQSRANLGMNTRSLHALLPLVACPVEPCYLFPDVPFSCC